MSRSRPLQRLVATSTLLVAGVLPAAAENLARGRAVAWSVAPTYPRCTDAADSLQLGDGLRAASDWIWLDLRSVGWMLTPGSIVALTIDLGGTFDLDSVVVYTASNLASEVLPPSLLVAAGETPSTFSAARGLDANALASPGDTGRARRVRLAVPLAGPESRYVLVAAMLQGPFFFADEIEVHGNESHRPAGPSRNLLAPPGPVPGPFALGDLPAVCAAQRRQWAMRAALTDSGVAGIWTASGEEEERLRARARIWRSGGAPAIQVRRVDPWAATTPWSAPQKPTGDTLDLWPGAWEAAAIEIANAGDGVVRVPVRTALAVPGAPRVDIREVVCVESRDGRWAGDALPLASESLAVRPGEVRQIWIDVVAHDAAPGWHRIAIDAGPARIEIPVDVRAVRLPPVPLAALDWTYPELWALPRAAPADAVSDNRAHGIDSFCLPTESVPWPDPAAIDAGGHLLQPPDFAACDRQLDLHGGASARRLGWYLDFKPALADPSRGHFRHPYLSAAWKRAVLEWLDLWLAHLAARGLPHDRVFVQPFDESTAPPVVALYRFLHAARPDLRLALTITRQAEPADLRALGSTVGLAILEREALGRHEKWIRRARARGGDTWTYDVLEPSKSTPPTAGYRLLAWEAWARGLAGCAFWSYGDTGQTSADAWDDFDAPHCDWAVVYGPTGAPRSLRGESFAPSKRWQAFRIGLQETALFAAAGARRPALRGEVLSAAASGSVQPQALRRRALRACR